MQAAVVFHKQGTLVLCEGYIQKCFKKKPVVLPASSAAVPESPKTHKFAKHVLGPHRQALFTVVMGRTCRSRRSSINSALKLLCVTCSRTVDSA